MFSKRANKFYHSLIFRLTLWYALIFVVISVIAFIAFYVSLAGNLEKRSKMFLLSKVKEFSHLARSKNIDAISAEFRREAQAMGIDNVQESLLDSSGTILVSSGGGHWRVLKPNSNLIRKAIKSNEPVFEVVKLPGFRHKVRVVYAYVGNGRILRIARNLKYEENLLYGMQIIFTRVMMLILGLSVLGSWWILTRAMNRVRAVTETATSISSTNLDRYVPVSGRDDEIDHLAKAFNEMLERIRTLINAMKEVTDNIAHDLKTPITRIRLIAESQLALDSEQQETLGAIIEQCDKLLGMINTALELRRLEYDSGIIVRNIKEVNLADLLRQAYEIFQPVAEDKDITLAFEAQITGSCLIRADRDRLQRAFANLIDNAIKYTPRGGKVKIILKCPADKSVVEISDTGIGISEQDLPNIFDKFYRGDSSRAEGGFGLGLTLTKSIIDAHKGTISVESQVNNGARFIVVLPTY